LAGSGISVCVCEPHAVRTPSMNRGFAGFVTSKMRMPSNPGARKPSTSGVLVLSQPSLVCGESTDWKSSRRLPAW
jgi:hypothetical protein